MVKGLPIARILVPIEARTDRFALNGKVFAQSINDLVEGRTLLGILDDQMGALVPARPLAAFDVLLLQIRYFPHQLVVQAPVVFGTKEFRDNDDIVVFHGLAVDGLMGGSDPDAQVRTDQRGFGVEGFRVATALFVFLDALCGVFASWIFGKGFFGKVLVGDSRSMMRCSSDQVVGGCSPNRAKMSLR